MANLIKLRKGLDINLKGKAAAEVVAVKEPGFYTLCPDDFTGVVAHSGSQALQNLECLLSFFGCEFKSSFIHCRSLLLMIYLLSCYNSSIHFWPDLVLSQMAKLAPIKAPSPINIVYSSILFLIYRYTS